MQGGDRTRETREPETAARYCLILTGNKQNKEPVMDMKWNISPS